MITTALILSILIPEPEMEVLPFYASIAQASSGLSVNITIATIDIVIIAQCIVIAIIAQCIAIAIIDIKRLPSWLSSHLHLMPLAINIT